jgi:hypothetical protein
MAEEKKGIEQLKKVVLVIDKAANVADQMVNEKGGTIAKLSHLMGLSGALVGLAGCSASELKAEFADLDAAEKAELMQFAKDNFDIAEDAVEAKIKAGLDLAVEGEAFVEKLIKFIKPAPVAQPAPAGA